MRQFKPKIAQILKGLKIAEFDIATVKSLKLFTGKGARKASMYK